MKGELPLSSLTRLASGREAEKVLNGGRGVVKISLEFRNDDQGRALVQGGIESELEVLCQRCLAPVTIRCAARVHLVGCRNETDAQRLGPGVEPLFVDQNETASLVSIIEDELILAMPAFAVHGENACEAPAHSSPDDDGSDSRRESPFSVLAGVKARN